MELETSAGRGLVVRELVGGHPVSFALGVRFVVAPRSVSIILQRAVNVPEARYHHDAKREIGQNIRQIREHQRRPHFPVDMLPHGT